MDALGEFNDRWLAFLIKTSQPYSSYRKMAAAVSIPPATLYDLVSGKTTRLANRQHHEALLKEAKKCWTPPWTDDEFARRELLKEDLGDAGPLPTAKRVADRWREAIQLWIDYASDTTRAPGSRTLHGLMASYTVMSVVSQPRHEEARKILGLSRNADAKREAIARIVSVCEDLMKLLDALPPEDFYGGRPITPQRHRGLRWLRLRILTNYLAAEFQRDEKEKRSHRDREKRMRRIIDAGFVRESNWVSEITDYEDIVPLKSAWVATVVAGDWSLSVEQAKLLFRNRTDILMERHCGGDGIVKDKDNWPGLAAITCAPLAEGLAEVWHFLSTAGLRDCRHCKELAKALPAMKESVQQGASHSDVLKAIGAEK